jgi:glycosyltransferase involved in cell wall biosynthesis
VSVAVHRGVAAIVPVFNHPHAVERVLRALIDCGLHCFLIDDGSEPACAATLSRIATQLGPEHVRLHRLEINQGKGCAIMTGLRLAEAAGFARALQIDADGQHDLSDVPKFLAASEAAPRAMIIGRPLFDDSVPRSRLIGRYATHVWVWINTLSLEIRDSMCGFRVYPLEEALAVIEVAHVGARMDFDTEILVRLHWRGVRMVNLPTRVIYPVGGVSHFRLLRDNWLITRMHTRLFFGMLPRLPLLLGRRLFR